jgi:hypothetical protein
MELLGLHRLPLFLAVVKDKSLHQMEHLQFQQALQQSRLQLSQVAALVAHLMLIMVREEAAVLAVQQLSTSLA